MAPKTGTTLAPLIFAGLVCFSVSRGASVSRVQDGKETTRTLSVTLRPSKVTIRPGQSIDLRIEIQNTGLAEVFVAKNLTLGGNSVSRLDLFLEHGSQIDRSMSNWAADDLMTAEPLAAVLARNWVALPPGAFYGGHVHMDPRDFPRLRVPGRYRVKGEYRSDSVLRRSENNPLRAHTAEILELPYGFWEGRTITNPVVVEVTVPKD